LSRVLFGVESCAFWCWVVCFLVFYYGCKYW